MACTFTTHSATISRLNRLFFFFFFFLRVCFCHRNKLEPADSATELTKAEVWYRKTFAFLILLKKNRFEEQARAYRKARTTEPGLSRSTKGSRGWGVGDERDETKLAVKQVPLQSIKVCQDAQSAAKSLLQAPSSPRPTVCFGLNVSFFYSFLPNNLLTLGKKI